MERRIPASVWRCGLLRDGSGEHRPALIERVQREQTLTQDIKADLDRAYVEYFRRTRETA